MAELIASSERDAVIGMGATGLSVARFLQRQGRQFVMLDTRTTPPNLDRFRKDFPNVPCELGPLSESTVRQSTRVVVSPGISLAEPPLVRARDAGIPLLGDIQLFAEASPVPVVGITGSNGKSTVTVLVGRMVVAAGHAVGVGGNLGTPALDLLEREKGAEYYVLELSSFQLETTADLNAEVAALLNVSHDHMDRYESLQAYHAAKQRVYRGAKKIVINRDDPLTQPPLRNDVTVTSFGAGKPDLKHFGLIEEHGVIFLARGLDRLLPVTEMRLAGKHNWLNALAALAIGHSLNLPMDAMLRTLREFEGLPHRCQWVAKIKDVDFYNDSKATNVGAAVAALKGLARQPAKLVLIAGGEGKGADFSPLGDALAGAVRAVITIGRDGGLIGIAARKANVDVQAATDMTHAVNAAAQIAEPGDAVLLSPACASFDMFDNFEHRGQVFIDAVTALA